MLKATLSVMTFLVGLVSQAGAQQWGASAPAAAPRAEASAHSRSEPSPSHAPREVPRSETPRAAAAADAIITESHIARLRAALRLTPAQHAHWAPVEAALSELARQQARGEAAGFTAKLTDRSSAVAATTTHLRRIKAIALPLIHSLDDNQKRDAIAFGRNMGLQQLVAAF